MAKKAAPKAAAEPKAAPKAAEPKAAPKAAEPKSAPKPITKGEIYAAIAEKTNLSKKQVSEVFDTLTEVIGKELGKKGPGLFIIPGLLKIKVVSKPATKARPGFNPATKQPITIKAKPARKVVKALPLKALKELI